MKKFILVLILFLLLPRRVFGASGFDGILSDNIDRLGVFTNGAGLVYAGDAFFNDYASLLLIHADESSFVFDVYDDYDGIQLTDSLTLPYGNQSCRFALVTASGHNYIMRSEGGANEFYTIENDEFTGANNVQYDSVTYIASCSGGSVTLNVKTVNIYRYLNKLKENTIADYPFLNTVNSVSDEELSAIRLTLTACADIMSYDVKDYDYDLLFKYVLYTHKNFQILCPLSPMSGDSSSLGYNNVSIVSGEYIDYIMNNVFHITPKKPPVNNLTSRGFCYSDGYYFYTGGFDRYFATEIEDIVGIYNIGGGVVFVVFSDIYSEGGGSTPEYSYAVLQKNDGGYSLLRIGMGEALPSAEEVRAYSPFSSYNRVSWGGEEYSDSTNRKPITDRFLLPFLLLVISVGAVTLVCSIVSLVKQRRG